MSCTCFKRQYPCKIHAPGHLPQPTCVLETTIVVHIYCYWADGSTNPDDQRWGYEVSKDCIQIFKSGAKFMTRQQCLDEIKMKDEV